MERALVNKIVGIEVYAVLRDVIMRVVEVSSTRLLSKRRHMHSAHDRKDIWTTLEFIHDIPTLLSTFRQLFAP